MITTKRSSGTGGLNLSVIHFIDHVITLIRVCVSRILIIICKTPDMMNCSNQRSGNDKIVVCRKAYHKNYYAKSREQILARQKRYRTENAEILKLRRKSWYEIKNRERLAAARELHVNTTRNTSEITEDNTVKTTGNVSRNIGEVIMLRIRNRSGINFVTKNKENKSE